MKKYIDLNNGLTAEKKDVVFLNENKRFAFVDTSVKCRNKKELREYVLNNSMLPEIAFVIFRLKTYSISEIYTF